MPNLLKRTAFIDFIADNYQEELKYYTHPGVMITAHQVGTLQQSSWSELLISKGVIDATPGVHKYIELERTLSALYCFQLCLDENYEDFVEAQPAHDKLDRKNFQELCKLTKAVAADEDSKSAIINLIFKSDLGKSPAVRALAKQAGIDPRLDTDELMLEILRLSPNEIIKILPSFRNMSDTAKALLVKSYPMMLTCYGHLYFLEAGEKTLENMAAGLRTIPIAKRKKLLKLVSVAQFFDAIGAQGQLNMNGSVTCTNNFFKGYMSVLDTFEILERSLLNSKQVDPVGYAFYLYTHERGDELRLYVNAFDDRADFEVVLRLACTLRIFDDLVADKLKLAYEALKPEYRKLLKTQLSLDKTKGINTFTHSPHYIASSAQNISRVAFESGDVDEAINKALNAEVCFAMLVKELIENHSVAANHPRYPLSFAKLAALGSDNPEKMDATLARWALPRPVPATKIKNLIFDLGHVFIRIDVNSAPVYKAFSELARRQGKTISADEIKALLTPVVKELIHYYHLGKVETRAFRWALQAHLGLEDISDEDFDTAWCASILDNAPSVKQRLEVLNQLFEKGYNIYLLSNNNEIHRLHTKKNFEGLYWGKYFFKQYYSNETGLNKPCPEAYTRILSDNRLNADETMFFDDVKAYIQAAWGVHIRGRQFTVDYGMNNVKVMIEAIIKAEDWATANNFIDAKGKPFLTRQSTLNFFAVVKWRSYRAPEITELSDADVRDLEQGTCVPHGLVR
jgi:FMN phosphatase YigB (HAD superfamily)